MYNKIYKKIKINGLSESTHRNYCRSAAQLALYFGKTPLEVSDEQITDYLYLLKDKQHLSASYFKHTVYGLRYIFRYYGLHERIVELPSMKKDKSLPVVLSKKECRRLFAAPRLLKHRVLLALIYSAGLRREEVVNLRPEDIDSDRMQIHIHQGKGGKDRYVVLSKYVLAGLRKYYTACRPVGYLFNGKQKGEPMSFQAVRWVMQQAVKKAGITKKATLHTLRHSFATHLLEDGVDLYSIKEQLGHASIQTTLVYLHIARTEKKLCHSPLDTLYHKQ